MNNLPLLSILFLIVISPINETQAQTHIGLRSGLNISKMNYYFDDIKVEDQEAVNKIETGIFIERNINSKFKYLWELNYFESGVSIPSIPFSLTTKALETNGIIKFQIFESTLVPNLLAGVGIHKYLSAEDSNGFSYDLNDDSLNEFGIGYLLGMQLEYYIDSCILFFDARLKNSLSQFIDNTTNEDFTIKAKTQEVVFTLGFKYALN